MVISELFHNLFVVFLMLTLVEVNKYVVVRVVHYFIEVASHQHLDSVFRVVLLSVF